MIVKNEEQNLAACLDSVAELIDEMVIVDTGSTDATVDLARSRGAKVIHFPWVDDFAAARNEALRHATAEWIFWMDADDRLDKENRRKLRELFTNLPTEAIGFVMKCLCLPESDSGTATVVDHVRLFPNHAGLRWKYRVHEQILGGIRRLGGSVRWSDVVIHHVGYQDASLRHKKLARDLRLLHLEDQENPDDPFTLFNLGSVYMEQNLPEKALAVLERSLRGSNPTDSIVRKLYSMLAQSHRLLGDLQRAEEMCREGRAYYPDDPEILFQESIVRQKLGDCEGAIRCLLNVVQAKDGAYFASIDTALCGSKAHHNLAVLYQETGRWDEAERHWKLALEKGPTYLPALIGLGDLYMKRAGPGDLQAVMRRLEAHPHGKAERLLLQARRHLAAQEFSRARSLVDRLIEEVPESLPARITLSHILLQEGKDGKGAERALRAILDRDPNNREARQNLEVLLHQMTKLVP